MTGLRKTLLVGAGAGLAALAAAGPAAAAVSAETAFIFNTLQFLIHGFLVMFMAAGFAMLESGLVRTKNTATICLKNITLYSIAGIMYYIVGYNVMYSGVPDGGFFGSLALFYNPGAAELALMDAGEATPDLVAAVTDNGYSVMSDWFFQMVFVATTASIISGTVAERIRFWPFMMFVVVLAAIIYPVQAAWSWGGGYLAAAGFSDFAGSTIVHSVGGWAALAGAIVLGARKGKYGPDGRVNPMPGANLPLATLGTFILWLGWFGFNGGSQLALGSALDAVVMSTIYVNTNVAAAAGVVTACILTQVLYGKIDLTMALNGALAGLVSITAGPDVETPIQAILIGAIGSGLVVIAIPLVDKLRIDDVVGAISVHLIAGIWGTLAVAVPGLNGSGDIVAQVTGIVMVGAWTFGVSLLVWSVLKLTMGVRVDEEAEENGLDQAELGMEAYPEFGRGSKLF